MLIILEGCDGVGKTSTADMLEELIRTRFPGDDITCLHASAPILDPLDEYTAPLRDYEPGTGKHFIIDRWHWGEMVYPAVLGRESQFDLSRRRYVELFLAAKGALMVEVRRDARLVAATLTTRRANGFYDPIMPGQVELVAGYFSELRGMSILNSIWVNSHSGTNAVIDTASEVEIAVSPLADYPMYIGPPAPQTLLVGDVRGELAALGIPCFVPYNDTPGHFLLKSLGGWWFQTPNRIGIADTCDPDIVTELMEFLKPIRVVTLGVEAQEVLGNVITAPMGAAPQPALVQRLYPAHGKDYGREILDAAVYSKDTVSWRPM